MRVVVLVCVQAVCSVQAMCKAACQQCATAMQAAARASARRRAGSSRRGLICLLAGAAGGGGAKVCGAKVVDQVLVWWVKCLECGAACGRARPCVARRVVDADVSAELGICGARSAEQYLALASEEVSARARERGMVPVQVMAVFFSTTLSIPSLLSTPLRHPIRIA